MPSTRFLCLILGMVWTKHCAGLDDPYPIPNDIEPPSLDLPRSERFPSVEQRLQLYLGDWYLPPCHQQGLVTYQYLDNNTFWPQLLVQEPRDRDNATVYRIDHRIAPDRLFYYQDLLIDYCPQLHWYQPDLDQHIQERELMRKYCFDARDSVMTAVDHVLEEEPQRKAIPLLLQFGDNRYSHEYGFVDLPHIKKFRSAFVQPPPPRTTASCAGSPRPLTPTTHHATTLQPILWKLATSRHFGLLGEVYRDDTRWSNKRPMAVFRGQLTGSKHGYNAYLEDEENCQRLLRCRLVYNHANSSLVEAKLTSTRGRLPATLNGVHLLVESVTIRHMLRFKAVIMLEGNDVASGLKWALLSQSVVLMPVPMFTSWAMEELLQPWVHYIPLNHEATDVEEKMQWIIDHDDVARRIAERGSQWMQDMVFHPDAAQEDRWMQEEILRRYFAHFEAGVV